MRTTRALIALIATAGCAAPETLDPLARFELPDSDLPPVSLPTRIGFGSCSDPALAMPTLDVVTDLAPEIHIWLGDNVYADTTDMSVMRSKYAELANAPEFLNLRGVAHFLATWDDHDFGANDAGRDFPAKSASKNVFLEFWNEPPASARWERDGIYTAYRFEDDGHALQLILLDTRYNRDALTPNDGSGQNDYVPNTADASLLGEAQWAWLAHELEQPADLRIVASSIQFANAYNGYESWSLFPAERERLVELIRTTRANGVLVISGDVHWAEVSRLDVADGYDLYDVTSSGINQGWPFVTDNEHRLGEPVAQNNVGLLTIDWAARTVSAFVYDAEATPRIQLSLSLDELTH